MSGMVSKLQSWLTSVNAFRRNQYVVPQVIPDNGTTLFIDAAKSNNWKITLTGNRTLANPTNLKEGMVLNIAIDQDATGSRVLTYGTAWKAVTGQTLVLSTGASAKDFLCTYYDGSILRTALSKAFV